MTPAAKSRSAKNYANRKSPPRARGHTARKEHRAGILVLGMHRSGTSAITRVLNLLGVELGGNLMPAQAGVNDKGFWEHVNVVAMHDRLLHWHDSNWSDIQPLPPMDLREGIGHQAVEDALALIRRDFANADLWAIKDPRMSLFAPVWLQAMAGEGIAAKVIIAVRHPGEVADSLHKRDGLTRGHAYLLWGRHVVEAVRASEGTPRAVSDYAGLLRDWRRQVVTLADDLEVSWPMSPEAAGSTISEFLSEDDRHHRAEDAIASDDPLERCVHEMYAHLARIAGGNDEWELLAQSGAEFERLTGTLVPHLADVLRQVWLHADRARRAEEVIGGKQLQGDFALAEQMGKLQMDLAAREERLLALAREQGEAASRATAQAEFQGLGDTLRALQEQFSDELRDNRDARMQSLQDLIEEKDLRLQEASEAEQRLESWVAELKLHVSNLEARRAELESEASASAGYASDLKEQLAEHGARVADLQVKLDQSRAHAEMLEREKVSARSEADALVEDLADRDARLQVLSEDLADRGAKLQVLSGDLADCDAKLQVLSEHLADRDAKLRALSEDLAAREARMKSLAEDLKQRNARQQAFAEEISERDTRLQMLSKQLAERETRLHALSEELAARESRLQALSDDLVERDVRLQRNSEQLADSELRLRNTMEQLSQAQLEIVASRAYAESLEQEVRRIMASRSWRYTAIFRRSSK